MRGCRGAWTSKRHGQRALKVSPIVFCINIRICILLEIYSNRIVFAIREFGADCIESHQELKPVSSLSINPAMTSVATSATRSAAPARAADGDYKTAGQGHTTKDSDGDYKAAGTVSAAPVTASATSASAVQAALASLKKGG